MSQSAAKPIPSVDKLSYEQAREELAEVVGKLESGRAPLAEALALWERGEALAAHCQQILDDARNRVAKVRKADAQQTDE